MKSNDVDKYIAGSKVKGFFTVIGVVLGPATY